MELGGGLAGLTRPKVQGLWRVVEVDGVMFESHRFRQRPRSISAQSENVVFRSQQRGEMLRQMYVARCKQS